MTEKATIVSIVHCSWMASYVAIEVQFLIVVERYKYVVQAPILMGLAIILPSIFFFLAYLLTIVKLVAMALLNLQV